MNNPMKAIAGIIMSPMMILLRSDSNILRSVLYALFSALAIICFYALLVVTTGMGALYTYKTIVIPLGMLPSIVVMSYITYLFSGISRNQAEIRSFVARVVGQPEQDEGVVDTQQITVVVLTVLASIFLLLGFVVNALYIFLIGIGFRIMLMNQTIGILIIVLTIAFTIMALNSKAIKKVFADVMNPLARKLHHA